MFGERLSADLGMDAIESGTSGRIALAQVLDWSVGVGEALNKSKIAPRK